jgi:Predicted permeases
VRQHRAFGNVDLKLGLIMAIGTIAGAEVGAQLIQIFKRAGNVNVVVSVVSIVVYLSISAFMLWESRKTLILQKKRLPEGKVKGVKSKEDHSAFGPVTRAIQRLKIWPMVSLPASGIKEISLWLILWSQSWAGSLVAFSAAAPATVRMPSMVYVLGIPTHLAVGTDLFEIIISASYGTFTHAVKGNVDILIALVMHTGAAIGAQIGVFARNISGSEDPPRFCAAAVDRRGDSRLYARDRPQALAMKILICSDGTPSAQTAIDLADCWPVRSQPRPRFWESQKDRKTSSPCAKRFIRRRNRSGNAAYRRHRRPVR